MVVVASQQFRARDCRKCSVFLHCKTQPVIESCHKLKFNCYQAFYPELRGVLTCRHGPGLSLNNLLSSSPSDQFLSADLHPFHNQWSLLHDFTGQNRGTDRSITQETTPPISPPAEGDLSGCGLSFERGQSTVPYTSGTASRPAEGEVESNAQSVCVASSIPWLLPARVGGAAGGMRLPLHCV